MQTISIDIETYSSVDIKTAGMYKYAESPDFEIMLFAYSIDGGPVSFLPLKVWDEYYQKDIDDMLCLLQDPFYIKSAYNAQFERVCLSKYFEKRLDPAEWECTMVKAAMVGLPFGLDQVSKVLNLPQQKMSEGKALINYFCKPCKPTKANGFRTRNLPEHTPEKWELFKDYCKQDVVTEMAVRNKIAFFKVPEMEKRVYCLDQKINDTGIEVDPIFINAAIKITDENLNKIIAKAKELTKLSNPNSLQQLAEWYEAITGDVRKVWNAAAVEELYEVTEYEEVKQLLRLRRGMSKSSVKKYTSMIACVCADNRIRGIHQYYGANRTGRWAGRLVQPQNMPQNHLKDLDLARDLVRSGDAEIVELMYGNVPDTLSQLIRTAFVTTGDTTFTVSDFSSIEARIIAWLAGERWRLDVFNTHGKIYEASASQMFKIPMDKIDKPLRQKGKIAELALGYGGSVDALKTMGAIKMGLTEGELPEIVNRWRYANLKIVDLWAKFSKAALLAVRERVIVDLMFGIRLYCSNGCLFMRLPSGRLLSYVRPRIGINRFGSSSIMYEGMNQTTKKWEVQETYGGKLVENAVQAIARDILSEKMLQIDTAGYKIVMHVHDEIITEGGHNKDAVTKIMSEPVTWAPALPLGAVSFESKFYKKD